MSGAFEMVPMQPQKIKAFFDDFLPVFASKIGVDDGEMHCRSIHLWQPIHHLHAVEKANACRVCRPYRTPIVAIGICNLNFGFQRNVFHYDS